MCIIILRPADVALPDDATLQRCWTRNPDGGGLMWANGVDLRVHKGFMTFESFLRAIKAVPIGFSAAYHFRIGTHGAKDAENTHPWRIDEDTALVHNGILQSFSNDHTVSDSYRFAQAIRGLRWFDDDANDTRILINSALGYHNKAVLMHADGSYFIANETAGMKSGGCWYSNGGFEEPKPTPVISYSYQRHNYGHNEYPISECSPRSANAIMLDELTVTRLGYTKKTGLVHMWTKAGKHVKMISSDFVKHYAIYDYATPALTAKADALALSIMDQEDQKQLGIDFIT